MINKVAWITTLTKGKWYIESSKTLVSVTRLLHEHLFFKETHKSFIQCRPLLIDLWQRQALHIINRIMVDLLQLLTKCPTGCSSSPLQRSSFLKFHFLAGTFDEPMSYRQWITQWISRKHWGMVLAPPLKKYHIWCNKYVYIWGRLGCMTLTSSATIAKKVAASQIYKLIIK